MGAAGSAIAGGVQLIQGMKSQKSAEKRANKQAKMSAELQKEELERIRALKPFLDSLQSGATPLIGQIGSQAQEAIARHNQYDPGRETEMLMREFDAGARDSLASDLAESKFSSRQRGFSEGNSSSDEKAMVQDTLGRRARDRGSYLSGLRLGERSRKTQSLQDASDMTSRSFSLLNPVAPGLATAGQLGGASGAAANNANMGYQMASQFNPAGAVSQISQGIRGLRFGPRSAAPDWTKGIAQNLNWFKK